MKQKFLVIGLIDTDIVLSVGLYDNSLGSDRKRCVIGTYIEEFDDYLLALDCAKDNFSNYELGIEIKTIFQ